MEKKVALYARVSTADQTPENQLLDLRRLCAARGWTPITPSYVDVGISGAKKDRPALCRLMEDVRKRNVDLVLVWRFDRFARSVPHLVAALEEFSERGVGFASYSENVDTTTTQGKLVFTIMAAIAQFERDLIRERIHSGLRRARAAGKRLGRPVRIGPVAIEQMQRLRADGLSVRAIGAALNVSKSMVAAALSNNPNEKVALPLVEVPVAF